MRKRGQCKVFEKEESETIEKKEEIEPTEVESDAKKKELMFLKGKKRKLNRNKDERTVQKHYKELGQTVTGKDTSHKTISN